MFTRTRRFATGLVPLSTAAFLVLGASPVNAQVGQGAVLKGSTQHRRRALWVLVAFSVLVACVGASSQSTSNSTPLRRQLLYPLISPGTVGLCPAYPRPVKASCDAPRRQPTPTRRTVLVTGNSDPTLKDGMDWPARISWSVSSRWTGSGIFF